MNERSARVELGMTDDTEHGEKMIRVEISQELRDMLDEYKRPWETDNEFFKRIYREYKKEV